MYQFPPTKDLQIAALYLQLSRHHNAREDFADDPITQYYGVAGEFTGYWDNKERKILAALHKRATQIGDTAALDIAEAGYEKWMP